MKSDFIQDLCANKFDALPDRLRSYKEPNTIKLCFKLINWAEINSKLQTVKISQIPRQK